MLIAKCDRCGSTQPISKLSLPVGWFDIKGLPTEYSSQQLCTICVAKFMAWVNPEGEVLGEPKDQTQFCEHVDPT